MKLFYNYVGILPRFWPGMSFSAFLKELKSIPKCIRWFFHRGYYGYCRSDSWSVDYYLNKVIPKLVQELINNHIGYGLYYDLYLPEFGNFDEFCESIHYNILQSIIDGFNSSQRLLESWSEKVYEDEYEQLVYNFNLGFELFHEYYNQLWD